MDSSGDPTTYSASVSDENLTTDGSTASAGGEKAMVALSKREKFLATYIRYQSWSLPESIIFYMAKNPSNSKVYQKMVQSCKYFFVQNPLLVVSDLYVKYESNQWNAYLNGKNVDLNRIISSKLWITDKLRIDNASSTPLNSLTTLLSKIHQNDVKRLFIISRNISINDLEFLASKCEVIFIVGCAVKNGDGSTVSFEKIVGMLPNMRDFEYLCVENASTIITPDTVKELIKVPHFPNLDRFVLRNLLETLDVDTFYGYIKNNNKTRIELSFGNFLGPYLSDAYKARLQTIVDEIISDPNRDYKLPLIEFPGMTQYSRQTLSNLYYSED